MADGEYFTGHIKHDPVTGWVALRTMFPEDSDQFRALAWLIATPNMGSKNASTADVEGWDDLFVAPAPDLGPGPV
jgi:hypothetical protein